MPGPQPCAATRYCFAHPVSPRIVGSGLDRSAGRRGRRPLQRWPETIPTPMHARGGLRSGRPTISRSRQPVGEGFIPPAHLPASTRLTIRHPVGAGHARPATSPPPAVNLPPPTNHCITNKPFHTTHHPHNLCPPTPITPIYTLPKLLPQTLSKKSKKLVKTC